MTRRTSAPRLGGAGAVIRPFTLLFAGIVIGAAACRGSTTGPGEDGPPSGTLQLKLIEQIPLPVLGYQGPWYEGQMGRKRRCGILVSGPAASSPIGAAFCRNHDDPIDAAGAGPQRE